MIPAQNIVAWSAHAPWAEQRQIEQDLIISRALVELFNDPFLRKQLRFRGGTALNKLHFPKPLRYSEDIDLVQTSDEPLKPILDRVHDLLDPWLGDPVFERSPVAPKFRYSVDPEDKSGVQIRLKLEINQKETEAFEGTKLLPFKVSNPWFSGETEISTFTNEELLSTKIRALLQRSKGRDLIDLSHALDVFKQLDPEKTVALLGRYLELSGTPIPRQLAEQRMFEKLGRQPDGNRYIRTIAECFMGKFHAGPIWIIRKIVLCPKLPTRRALLNFDVLSRFHVEDGANGEGKRHMGIEDQPQMVVFLGCFQHKAFQVGENIGIPIRRVTNESSVKMGDEIENFAAPDLQVINRMHEGPNADCHYPPFYGWTERFRVLPRPESSSDGFMRDLRVGF